MLVEESVTVTDRQGNIIIKYNIFKFIFFVGGRKGRGLGRYCVWVPKFDASPMLVVLYYSTIVIVHFLKRLI